MKAIFTTNPGIVRMEMPSRFCTLVFSEEDQDVLHSILGYLGYLEANNYNLQFDGTIVSPEHLNEAINREDFTNYLKVGGH